MFNMAQDICHYRHGNLKATSIHGSMMLKVFDRIELDGELNEAEDKDIPFPIFEDKIDDEEYDCLPDYISNFEEQEEVINSLSWKKIYLISRTLYLNLNELYDDYSGNLLS